MVAGFVTDVLRGAKSLLTQLDLRFRLQQRSKQEGIPTYKGETLIPLHSCTLHPLQVDVFLDADAANETRGWDKALFTNASPVCCRAQPI
ncbi:hypothetical protein MHYP_G00040510 [Metynnis hypsauchen]